MTRYGHTPYLQAIFKSSACVYGSKSSTQANWDLIEVEGNNEVGSDDLGIYYETIYEQGFVRVKVVVESVGQLGIEEYLKHNESSDIFSAGLVALGTTSRVRRYFNGQVDFDSAEKILKFKSEVTLSVSDLMGTLQLEPVVIAKIDLIDPLNGLGVLPGTVLATSGSVVLKDKPLENKFGDLFRYEWINFSETENYKKDELFDIVFVSVPPRILLNKGIQCIFRWSYQSVFGTRNSVMHYIGFIMFVIQTHIVNDCFDNRPGIICIIDGKALRIS
mgnify:CR=1 FL=1